ncbi:hypothetical protein BKA66DRAFT_445183 [Pyrenochaeta sp. MPI-SDFR-AT-0127]|nr:hypothetical protein BKA66DRAFT_445183 [Pyrenochaeta sp. MPI-SDFR-AT-0127]
MRDRRCIPHSPRAKPAILRDYGRPTEPLLSDEIDAGLSYPPTWSQPNSYIQGENATLLSYPRGPANKQSSLNYIQNRGNSELPPQPRADTGGGNSEHGNSGDGEDMPKTVRLRRRYTFCNTDDDGDDGEYNDDNSQDEEDATEASWFHHHYTVRDTDDDGEYSATNTGDEDTAQNAIPLPLDDIVYDINDIDDTCENNNRNGDDDYGKADNYDDYGLDGEYECSSDNDDEYEFIDDDSDEESHEEGEEECEGECEEEGKEEGRKVRINTEEDVISGCNQGAECPRIEHAAENDHTRRDYALLSDDEIIARMGLKGQIKSNDLTVYFAMFSNIRVRIIEGFAL